MAESKFEALGKMSIKMPMNTEATVRKLTYKVKKTSQKAIKEKLKHAVVIVKPSQV